MDTVAITCPNCKNSARWCRRDALPYNLLVVSRFTCLQCGATSGNANKWLYDGEDVSRRVELSQLLDKLSGDWPQYSFKVVRKKPFDGYVKFLPSNAKAI